METVDNRELNRATLTRQLLLERVELDVPTAVERLVGMQGQYSPSPYIGLWSRLAGFEREHLADALRDETVVKTTVMRGTLHLVATRRLADYRIATRSSYYEAVTRDLRELGADIDAIRAHVVAEVGREPHTRQQVSDLIAASVGDDVPEWVRVRMTGVAGISVATDLCNLPDDAAFGYFGGSRYRVAPAVPPVEPDGAYERILADYLNAYGPASKADLAQWSGMQVRAFAAAIAALDLVHVKAEDGRALLDLQGAPRPPADTPAPVRFLPKWDSLLLAHAKRERVITDAHRKVVIRKNGDVKPTFLLDGMVAGTWEAPLRGRAVLTLTPLESIARRQRADVEAEGERLHEWLRPDAKSRDLRWAD